VYETVIGSAVIVAIVGDVSVLQTVELPAALCSGFLDDLCITSLGGVSRRRIMPVALRRLSQPLEVLAVKALQST